MKNIIKELNLNFTICTHDSLVSEIEMASENQEPGYAVFCSVHSLVNAYYENAHLNALRNARWLVADGFPVAWLMRKLGMEQCRVSGPDVMERFLNKNTHGMRVYLLGSTEEVCLAIVKKFKFISPNITFVGYSSPIINSITSLENDNLCRQIRDSGANSVWVSLGCPKQEQWSERWNTEIGVPVLAVGAAFDFIAAKKKRAPLWMQNCSLEWLYRLFQEPKRLFLRYFITNFQFLKIVLF